MMNTVHCFAYGSNMNPRRMVERAPSAIPVGPAVIQGWKIEFDVISPHYNNERIAGIHRDSEGETRGVLYEISTVDKANLDKFEAETGYDIEWVTALGPCGQQCSFMYAMNESKHVGVSEGPISKEYLQDLRRGVEYFGLQHFQQLIYQISNLST